MAKVPRADVTKAATSLLAEMDDAITKMQQVREEFANMVGNLKRADDGLAALEVLKGLVK